MNATRALKTLSVAALTRRGVVLWSAPQRETIIFHSTFAIGGDAVPATPPLHVPVDEVSPGHGRALRHWLDNDGAGTLALPYSPVLGSTHPVYFHRLLVGEVMHGTVEMDRRQSADFWEGGFRAILISRLTESVRKGQPVAIGLITIRSFSFVRDGAGHAVAQAVMLDLQERLTITFGEDTDIGHFHSDVFAFISPVDPNDGAPEDVVRRKLALAFAAPFEIDSMTYRLTANAGVAVFPQDCDSVDDLLRAAEIALERAKRSIPDAVFRCEKRWLDDAKGTLMMAVDIYTGMTTNSFVPYIQPIVDLQTGSPISAEILMRWNHPSEGTVSPDSFIPIAERNGLITDLTISLLRTLCHLIAENGPPPHRLAINLSATDLTPGSMRRILNAIDNESLLPPELLTFEITETAIASEPDVARSLLEMIRERGTKVAIDDFGSGYSCFGALGSFPVDYLKIDRCFVGGVEARPERRRLVSAICAMSAEFGLPTVAEGVETEEAAATMLSLGGSFAQGYYYARPMPFDHYYRWLANQPRVMSMP